MNTILLIAEDPSIVEYFSEVLSPCFNLRCAGTEEEGLRAFNGDSQGVVAVLIELALARRSRFAFGEKFSPSSSFSTVPLIAISAALPATEDMDCIEHGFYDLITAYAPPQLIHKRINNAIRASDSLSLSQLEKMLKQLPACIFLKDTECRYVFSTQYWHHINTGDDPDWTIRGKTDLDIRKDRDNALKAMAADRRILETGEGTEYIIEENEDGILDYLQLIKRPVYDDDGKVSGIIALINNITDYQLLKMELEKRAKTDALTGLLNKHAAQDLVRMMLPAAHKRDERCALLMIDIDLFKQVNDTFGHAEGDRVLAEVGRIITNSCRALDVAGRIGGDEFMVFMRGIDAPENAVQLGNRLSDLVKRAFQDDKLEGRVSLSIGAAVFPEHGKDFDALFQSADAALYYAKKHGRDAVKLYAGD